MELGSERLLILAPSSRDGEIAREELERAGISAEVCPSIEALCAGIERGAGGALISEDRLSRADLERLAAVLARQPAWSDFPLLLLSSRSHGHATRLDVLGNVTVLDQPLRLRTMCGAAHALLRGRRRQYAAARAIDQRDRFLAMLGHELRNPLSAISFAVESASSRSEPADEVEVIGRQVDLLSRLVDDLLDVARVTAGKIALRPEIVDLVDVVERVIDQYRRRFDESDLALEVEFQERPILVRGDAIRLEQVASNLLANALKYTPGGCKVWVQVTGGDRPALVVADDGIGIDAEMLPRIFDAFTQADRSLARSQGGMGVGLTLVRTLVELHGGQVTAASGGLGEGSRFEVRLPAAPPGAVAPVRAEHTAPSSSRVVVLVEDHADGRELLAGILANAGNTVRTAADGESGVALIAEVKPDVAIVDIGLPDIDGFEVARRVREQLGTRTQLVALSGYGQLADKQRAREAGFDRHLTKPVSLRAVIEALDHRSR
jgi:signal transduction histidine kinase/CheY-like chemotaxis protein